MSEKSFPVRITPAADYDACVGPPETLERAIYRLRRIAQRPSWKLGYDATAITKVCDRLEANELWRRWLTGLCENRGMRPDEDPIAFLQRSLPTR